MIAGTISIELAANVARIQQDMEQARRVVSDATTRMSQMAGAAKSALTGLAGALSVGAFAAMIKGSIDAVDSLTDLSTRTSMTVEQLAGLSFGAKLSGTELEAAAGAISKLSVSIGSDGQKFAQIGVTAREPIEAFKQLADRFVAIKDPQQRAAFGAQYLGKSWQESAVLLNEGSEGIEKLMARGLELSGVTTKISGDAAAFNDKLDEIGFVASGAATRLASQFLPALNQMADMFVSFVSSDAVQNFAKGLANGIMALTAAIGPAIKIAAAYFAIFVAAPALLTATAAAMTPVVSAVAVYTMNVLIGQTATIKWNTALFGTAMAANTAAGGLFTLGTAAKSMFAVFAGWQIGTYLRENFVEARVAGLLFVGAMLKGWENLKYGALMAWEGIKFAWNSTINSMKATFGAYLASVGAGLAMVGAGDASRDVNAYAESLRNAAANQKSFGQQTASITTAHKAELAAIEENMTSLVAYELSTKAASKADADATVNAEAAAAAAAKAAAAKAAKAAAAKKERDDALKTAENYLASLKLERQEIGKNAAELKMLAAARAAAKAPTVELRREIMLQAEANAEATRVFALKTAAEDADKKAQDEMHDALSATTKSIDGQIEAMRKQIKVYGLSEAAVIDLALQEAEAARDAGGFNEAKLHALDEQIAKWKELRELSGQKEALEEQKKLADENLKANVSMWESIDKTAHDTFVSIFDSGKSTFDRLKDTLKNGLMDMLYQMTIKKWILNIQASTSSSGGIGGGATSYVEMGKNIYGAFAKAASSGGGLIGFGKSLYASFSGAGASAGAGATGSAAGGAGASGMGAIPVVGWIAAGMALSNKLYSEGWDANNGTINKSPGAILSTPMLALNKTLQKLGVNNKLANMLSGASTISRLFGRKNPEVTGFGIQGSFGGGGFNGQTYQDVYEKGGVFRSSKRYQVAGAVDGETESMFDDTIKNMMTAVKGFGESMGIEARSIDSFSKAIKLTLTNDEAKNQELIAGMFSEIGNDLATRLIPSIAQLKKQGESAAATLERIATNYAVIDVALNAMGKTFGAVGLSSIAARERLMELTGGLEGFGESAAFFVDNFLTEAERMVPVAAKVKSTLAGMGLSFVDTREEFKSIVLGLDLTTAAGSAQYAALMKLQEAFAQLYPATDAATSAVDSMGSLTDRLREFGQTARGLVNELKMGSLSTLTAEQQYNEARKQYEATVKAAASGDVNAQGDYSAMAKAFLESSRRVNASGAAYGQDYREVVGQAERFAKLENVQSTGLVIPRIENQIAKMDAGLVSELKALRAEVQGLRSDADRQTGDSIEVSATTGERTAEAIREAVIEAARMTNQAINGRVSIA